MPFVLIRWWAQLSIFFNEKDARKHLYSGYYGKLIQAFLSSYSFLAGLFRGSLALDSAQISHFQ